MFFSFNISTSQNTSYAFISLSLSDLEPPIQLFKSHQAHASLLVSTVWLFVHDTQRNVGMNSLNRKSAHIPPTLFASIALGLIMCVWGRDLTLSFEFKKELTSPHYYYKPQRQPLPPGWWPHGGELMLQVLKLLTNRMITLELFGGVAHSTSEDKWTVEHWTTSTL